MHLARHTELKSVITFMNFMILRGAGALFGAFYRGRPFHSALPVR